jgi:hypothetical protein
MKDLESHKVTEVTCNVLVNGWANYETWDELRELMPMSLQRWIAYQDLQVHCRRQRGGHA